MRSSQNKPELKDIKSRNVQEEGDYGVFRSPQQGVSDDSPPHQFQICRSSNGKTTASKTENAGSIPARYANFLSRCGGMETHLPAKQRNAGSSPVGASNFNGGLIYNGSNSRLHRESGSSILSSPTNFSVCSATGRGNRLRVYTVWVRIPPDAPVFMNRVGLCGVITHGC